MTRTRNGQDGPAAIPRLVDRLEDLVEGETAITLDALARTLGAQGHAPLLLVAAVLMILPIGMIPGIGGALGVLVAIIGLQMLLGRRGVWLPHVLGRREISAARVRALAGRIKPVSQWLRRHLRIRWEVLSGGVVSVTVIACILILSGGSLLLLGAIPVAAPLMGLPVAVFAFGLLARDGAVIAIGYALVAGVMAGLVLMRGAW